MDPGGEAVCTEQGTVYILRAFKTKQAREMVGALMNIGREGLAFGKCYLPTENADKSNPFIVLQV